MEGPPDTGQRAPRCVHAKDRRRPSASQDRALQDTDTRLTSDFQPPALGESHHPVCGTRYGSLSTARQPWRDTSGVPWCQNRNPGSGLRPRVCVHTSVSVLAILEITTLGEAAKAGSASRALSNPAEPPALGPEPMASALGGPQGTPSQGGERTRASPGSAFVPPTPAGSRGCTTRGTWCRSSPREVRRRTA